MGSTSNYTYIIFVCENTIRLLWAPSSINSYQKAGLSTYVTPIRLISNVSSVKILAIPQNIQEGVPFGENITQIQVFDSKGNPLPNKLVICLVASFNEQSFHYRYSSVKKGFLLKDIIKPFPGKYDAETLDPLSSRDVFVPILTNSQGYVDFSESFFSIYGMIGSE